MKIRYLLSIAALTLLAGVASAGFVQPVVVTVDLTNMFALGDQVTARTSKNDVEFIGCGIRVIDDGASLFSFGFCQAGDSEGVQFTCFTQNADLLDAMKAISAYAFITFGWDGNGDCTRIGFSTQSLYLPAQIKRK